MNTSNANNSARLDPELMCIQHAVQVAEYKADFAAQHGPVKILFKDGKPV